MITEIKPIAKEEQQRLNAEFGMRLNRETRANPDSPYVGKYVVIADCEVVTVGDTLDDMHEKILALGMNPRATFYIQASADYDTPIWITPQPELI